MRSPASAALGPLLLAAVLTASCAGDSGPRIVYVNCTTGTECSFVSIKADGSDREILFTLGGPETDPPRPQSPQCSPDGKELIYTLRTLDAAKPSFFRISLAGKAITELADTPAGSAVWSPDGTQIAYSGYTRDGIGTQIFTIEADSGGRGLPLVRDDRMNFSPAWSPDGSRIAYASHDADLVTKLLQAPEYAGDRADIYITLTETNGFEGTPLVTGPTNDSQPSWSPDGQTIAFIRTSDEDGQIFLVDADGQNVRQLSEGAPPKSSPRWSPDGKHMLFTSAPDETQTGDHQYQIYLVDADGSNQKKITEEESGANYGAWCTR